MRTNTISHDTMSSKNCFKAHSRAAERASCACLPGPRFKYCWWFRIVLHSACAVAAAKVRFGLHFRLTRRSQDAGSIVGSVTTPALSALPVGRGKMVALDRLSSQFAFKVGQEEDLRLRFLLSTRRWYIWCSQLQFGRARHRASRYEDLADMRVQKVAFRYTLRFNAPTRHLNFFLCICIWQRRKMSHQA